MLIPSFAVVLVGVRVRPLTAKERTSPTRSRGGPAAHFRNKNKGDSSDVYAWTTSGENHTIVQKGVRKVEGRSVFQFDSIFQENSTTQQVYDSMVQPIVRGVASGQNGTVFAYGQTSSGKTYTMQGSNSDDSSTTNDTDGIIQMVARDLFHHVEQHSSKREFCVRVSYVEIYSEKVRDLLSGCNDDDETTRSTSSKTTCNSTALHSSSGDLKTLAVREDPKRGGVYVNCKEWLVNDSMGVVNALTAGSKSRASSKTAMNDQSSRSHAIFRITVESREKDKDGVVRLSTLNLVDLAGSENGHQSAGHRQREGGKINQRYDHVNMKLLLTCLCFC